MARILVLDAGPLGIACGNPNRDVVRKFRLWAILAQINGARLIIPEIADYEVRRGLIAAGDAGKEGLRRLDSLRTEMEFQPINSNAMTMAAELWGRARRDGQIIGDVKALGGDAIVAAQALVYAGLADQMTMVTTDVDDLSRFVDAQPWEAITP